MPEIAMQNLSNDDDDDEHPRPESQNDEEPSVKKRRIETGPHVVCQWFLKGECKFGVRCLSQHPQLTVPPQIRPPGLPAFLPQTRILPPKAQLFANKFRPPLNRPLLPSVGNVPRFQPNTAPQSFGTTPQQEVCKFFQQGTCKFGGKCRSTHPQSSLAIPRNIYFSPALRIPSIPPLGVKRITGSKPGEDCRFFLRGNCQFGDECRAVHDQNKLKVKAKNNHKEIQQAEEKFQAAQVNKQLEKHLYTSEDKISEINSAESEIESEENMPPTEQKIPESYHQIELEAADEEVQTLKKKPLKPLMIKKADVCAFYLRGECKFNERCRAKHPTGLEGRNRTARSLARIQRSFVNGIGLANSMAGLPQGRSNLSYPAQFIPLNQNLGPGGDPNIGIGNSVGYSQELNVPGQDFSNEQPAGSISDIGSRGTVASGYVGGDFQEIGHGHDQLPIGNLHNNEHFDLRGNMTPEINNGPKTAYQFDPFFRIQY